MNKIIFQRKSGIFKHSSSSSSYTVEGSCCFYLLVTSFPVVTFEPVTSRLWTCGCVTRRSWPVLQRMFDVGLWAHHLLPRILGPIFLGVGRTRIGFLGNRRAEPVNGLYAALHPLTQQRFPVRHLVSTEKPYCCRVMTFDLLIEDCRVWHGLPGLNLLERPRRFPLGNTFPLWWTWPLTLPRLQFSAFEFQSSKQQKTKSCFLRGGDQLINEFD